MSNIIVARTAQFSPSEINEAVNAVSLPPALQGVDQWAGSKEVGGNSAAHIAAVNNKAQAIGLCQCFSDFWFGAESRANILKGIKNGKVRAAFDIATADVIRINGKPLDAGAMLDFLRCFTRTAMESATVKAEVLTTGKGETEGETTVDGENEGTPETETTSTVKVNPLIAAQAETIAQLQAELTAMRETITAVKVCKSMKQVYALLAA